MVTKSQGKSTKKGKVKVGKLKEKRNGQKLSAADKKEVRGGLGTRNVITNDPGLIC